MPQDDARSDEELMLAYVRGNGDAHRALFTRLAPTVRGVALKALRDPADADDVVQQTFLQLHRARREFREGARLRPWIFTIAMNLIRDTLRRRGRALVSPLGADAAPGADVLPPLPLEEEQEHTLLRAALETLPIEQRRAIELHWFEDRPFAEVAAIEGVSESAVKVRAHRGYKRLRLWFETDGRLSRM